MNQTSIISDLIKWIEKNLEKPLSIDHVSEKSGYSKWHLQRMFKGVTGSILGTYIRHRRLTHAALALKLTSKPILDIAMQYRFDSQQTFTRTFRKQFNITPANYRRAEYWDTSGLMPSIELYKLPLNVAMPKIVHLENKIFWGVSYKSCCNLYELFYEKKVFRQKFFENCLERYVKNKQNFPSKIFAFSQPKPSEENPDEQEILYTIGFEEKKNIEGVSQFESQAGYYAIFKYIGSVAEFWDFIAHIYLIMLPKLGMKRRNGSDIEIFQGCDQYDFSHGLYQTLDKIECDYCIPVLICES